MGQSIRPKVLGAKMARKSKVESSLEKHPHCLSGVESVIQTKKKVVLLPSTSTAIPTVLYYPYQFLFAGEFL